MQNKKFRKQHGLFIVEGIKSILEFVHSSYTVDTILATSFGWTKLGKIQQNIKCETVSEQEFSKISLLENPQGVLALVRIPTDTPLTNAGSASANHLLVLDDIQDPGNMGTIVRTAEWFGFRQIVCSIGTVDVYNPKVVQATMGSLARMSIGYTDLLSFFTDNTSPVFGALLQGDSIYEVDFGSGGIILMGNEGNGISAELMPFVDHPTTIPALGQAESLNVAVATTVFCSEIARRKTTKINLL